MSTTTDGGSEKDGLRGVLIAELCFAHSLTPTPKLGAHQRHWAEILFLVVGKLGGGETVYHLCLRQEEYLIFFFSSH